MFKQDFVYFQSFIKIVYLKPLRIFYWVLFLLLILLLAQSAGDVEYTDCVSAKGKGSTNLCPGYDTKQSYGEVPVMLELWGMLSTLPFQSLSGSLWLGAVAPEKVQSMGQIELNYVLMPN